MKRLRRWWGVVELKALVAIATGLLALPVVAGGIVAAVRGSLVYERVSELERWRTSRIVEDAALLAAVQRIEVAAVAAQKAAEEIQRMHAAEHSRERPRRPSATANRGDP